LQRLGDTTEHTVNHRDNRTAQQRPDADNGTDTATDSTDSFRVAPTLLAQRAGNEWNDSGAGCFPRHPDRLCQRKDPGSWRGDTPSALGASPSSPSRCPCRCPSAHVVSAVSAAQTARPCRESPRSPEIPDEPFLVEEPLRQLLLADRAALHKKITARCGSFSHPAWWWSSFSSPVGCPLAVPGCCPYPDVASVPAIVGRRDQGRV